MILAISVFGIELFSIRLGRPAALAVALDTVDGPREEPDPSTYTTRGAPRLAETELPADPDPIDRFGFGFATPGGHAGATHELMRTF